MTVPPVNLRPIHFVTFGECMMELSGPALSSGLDPLRQGYGGDAYNTAFYLARLSPSNWKVSFASSVGQDDLSSRLLHHWVCDGVSTDLVQRAWDRTIAVYLIQTDDTGERKFTFWRDRSAAKTYFDHESTPLDRMVREGVGGIDVLYFTGISLAILTPEGRERLFSLVSAVQATGGKFVFDNNYRPSLWTSASDARQWILRGIEGSDIAFVTLDDHQALMSGPDSIATEPAAIEHLCGLAKRELVVKRGHRSTLGFQRGALKSEAQVMPVSKVVDTTAAGDSFAAGYLVSDFLGRSQFECLLAGNAVAAEVIQGAGALVQVSVDLLRR